MAEVKPTDPLVDRFHALASIIRGLSAFVIGDYETANTRFSDALNENAWDSREVLYVMIGSSLVNEGLLREDPSLYAAGETYYRKAIEANDKYSRAYVGLASVLYERARSSAASGDATDVAANRLAEATRLYEEALNPDQNHSPFAEIESKVNFGLGQVYALKAVILVQKAETTEASVSLGQALTAYQSVIDEYEQADPDRKQRLEERAAHAHARLGFIYSITNHLGEARQEYTKALAMMPQLDRARLDRARYEAALGKIDLDEGKLEDAKQHYEQAVELAPDGAPEKPDYQQSLSQLRARIDEGASQ